MEHLELRHAGVGCRSVLLEARCHAPKADVWSTIGGLLLNTFIEALRRGLEGSVELGGAKTKREGASKRDG